MGCLSDGRAFIQQICLLTSVEPTNKLKSPRDSAPPFPVWFGLTYTVQYRRNGTGMVCPLAPLPEEYSITAAGVRTNSAMAR